MPGDKLQAVKIRKEYAADEIDLETLSGAYLDE